MKFTKSAIVSRDRIQDPRGYYYWNYSTRRRAGAGASVNVSAHKILKLIKIITRHIIIRNASKNFAGVKYRFLYKREGESRKSQDDSTRTAKFGSEKNLIG